MGMIGFESIGTMVSLYKKCPELRKQVPGFTLQNHPELPSGKYMWIEASSLPVVPGNGLPAVGPLS